MEGKDIYEDATAFHIDEQNGDEFEPRDLKPEHWTRRADTARRNLPPKIIYTLLGICIVVSVLSLAIALALMAQMGEIKRSDADFRMESSQWKNNVTGNVEKATSSLSDVQAEIALLRELTGNVEKATSSLSDVQAEVALLRELAGNLEKAIAQLSNLQTEIPWQRESVHSCPEQWTKFKQSCYLFSSSLKSWEVAGRTCASADAHLVVINNAEEQGFIKNTTNVRRWIGLSDSASEGDWRWVDGTDYKSSVKFWNEGEPNNANNAEHCGEMFGDGRWNDQSCNYNQEWICEKPAQ
ncbi:C-type lectin domain family 4 member M-like isoform X2 [Leucoraja erinacea]|uniref:C-type lectin domain family 4 member M-like isoform X2 n=1 Tax=Leucoraja erinaceus TaxID=7782 RepID=UPI0024552926|nr:C-type lectin domain family 4 member M-like isoform X2 [Leucoraja erinacea]